MGEATWIELKSYTYVRPVCGRMNADGFSCMKLERHRGPHACLFMDNDFNIKHYIWP